jgi:hypothetical protein
MIKRMYRFFKRSAATAKRVRKGEDEDKAD